NLHVDAADSASHGRDAPRGHSPPLFTPLSAPTVETRPLGTIVCSYQGHSTPVRSLSWVSNGARIISVGDDKTVHVWDASTGSNLQLYQDASDALRLVAWSSDGSRTVTAGVDALVRVWDV